MANKAGRRATVLRMPHWAGASLGFYLVLTLLYPYVGRMVHGLTLYLLPVVLAAQGGVGPGFAMIAASLLAHAAIDLQVLGTAVSPAHSHLGGQAGRRAPSPRSAGRSRTFWHRLSARFVTGGRESATRPSNSNLAVIQGRITEL